MEFCSRFQFIYDLIKLNKAGTSIECQEEVVRKVQGKMDLWQNEIDKLNSGEEKKFGKIRDKLEGEYEKESKWGSTYKKFNFPDEKENFDESIDDFVTMLNVSEIKDTFQTYLNVSADQEERDEFQKACKSNPISKLQEFLLETLQHGAEMYQKDRIYIDEYLKHDFSNLVKHFLVKSSLVRGAIGALPYLFYCHYVTEIESNSELREALENQLKQNSPCSIYCSDAKFRSVCTVSAMFNEQINSLLEGSFKKQLKCFKNTLKTYAYAKYTEQGTKRYSIVVS